MGPGATVFAATDRSHPNPLIASRRPGRSQRHTLFPRRSRRLIRERRAVLAERVSRNDEWKTAFNIQISCYCNKRSLGTWFSVWCGLREIDEILSDVIGQRRPWIRRRTDGGYLVMPSFRPPP